MSKQIQTTKDDAQTTKQPLRFEAVVTWDRPLTEPQDNPERLKERLSVISVDGDVSVREFSDTNATVWVETTPEEMGHSVGLIAKKVRATARAYNQHVISGDDLTDIPTGSGVKKKHVKWAYEGKDRRDLNRHIAPEAWESAKEIAEGLNLEGAPALEPDISIRTIDGKL